MAYAALALLLQGNLTCHQMSVSGAAGLMGCHACTAAGEASGATDGGPEVGQPVVYATPFEQQPNLLLRKPAKPLPAEPKPRSKAKKGGEQVRLSASDLLARGCFRDCC